MPGGDQKEMPAWAKKPYHGGNDVQQLYSQTEANILPETAEEPGKLDLEVDMEKKSATPSPMDPASFPDGGLDAWLVVLGGFCCLFSSFGWINCIGVFQDYYQTHQLRHLSPSTVAWIPSLETFMMFVGGPIIGKFYDNYGPRYILLFGSFMHVFGLMMTSISTEYYQFVLAQGICSPIGASAIFYSGMSCVTTWFFHRRALALGITATGSSFGGVIFPIMVERLVQEVGFGWAMRISTFLILFMLIIANLTVKSRLPPTPKPLILMEFIHPLMEIPFLLLCIGSFLFFLGLFLPLNFIILQAKANGMSAHLAGYLLAILNATSIFGRIIPGYVADRIGRFNVMVFMAYFSAVIVLALWLPAKSNAPIIVFAVLYGFGSGAIVSLIPALIAQISDIRKIGVRNGTIFAIVSVAALVGNPIGGALLAQANGSFVHAQIFCGVVMVVASTCFVASRYTLAGWNPMTKV